jgi:hypothetical protein
LDAAERLLQRAAALAAVTRRELHAAVRTLERTPARAAGPSLAAPLAHEWGALPPALSGSDGSPEEARQRLAESLRKLRAL